MTVYVNGEKENKRGKKLYKNDIIAVEGCGKFKITGPLAAGGYPLFLNEIQLNHYRNYEHLTLSTDHRVNLFVGANAQGKTNLLEAIFVLALSKSHRTHKDKELIAWQADQRKSAGRVERKLSATTASHQAVRTREESQH